MGFPRQEYCSGLPFPSLGGLPDPGIESIGRWIIYHWASDAIPPNMNMMHLWIHSCFNSNVTPLWILCLNLFFFPESRTLAHWMQQEWKLIYCLLVSCSTFCEAFSGFPAPLQWFWIKLWGSLITIAAAKLEPFSKPWNANFKIEGIQENWLCVCVCVCVCVCFVVLLLLLLLFWLLPDRCESDWYQMRNKHMRWL